MGTIWEQLSYLCGMKISAFIRKAAKKNDTDSTATIYFRLRDGKKDIKAASELSINPSHWSPEKQGYKDRVALVRKEEQVQLNNEVHALSSLIASTYTPEADNEWLAELIRTYHHPQRAPKAIGQPNLIELLDEFLEKHPLSEVRKKNNRVLKRGLQRYELYTKKTLFVDRVTSDTLHSIWGFFENEHLYYTQRPDLFASIPQKRTPTPRGKNTLIDYFSRLRTFFLWCVDQKVTQNRPFDTFPIEECVYGTPYYISIDERNKIYRTNLSRHPELAVQRDIFVFHCLIGCRVGDLLKMTRESIISGAVEYIPGKTKNERPTTVRVPLNDTAREIVERYANTPSEKLLPFIVEQEYNESIKKVFKAAELKRMVTVLNPTTRKEEKRILYEIASSHLARRTFVGNLYKQVKDPNLVGALSGHKEGSKAFARYRDIDEEMKKELVDLLQ